MKAKLIAYLASYIDATVDITSAILTAIAAKLQELADEITALPDANHAGRGLQMEADDWHILRSGKELDATLQALLVSRYVIHTARGTEAQAIEDVQRLANDSFAAITFKTEEQVGWWLEGTFPEHDSTFLDAGATAHVTMANHSGMTDQELQGLIRREVLPVQVTVLF
jgi:hypothetical protein